jgi:anthranilate synthase/aminodeoxychorismate synthase-like glutamine amidotransferase
MVDVLVIDNIDSFVYNLVQYIGELGATPKVKMNDITIEKIKKINPDKIVISPGPGRPENAGNIVKIIQEFGPKIPILGVCLGHQGIAIAYDGTVGLSKNLMHGKVSVIKHDGKGIFQAIKNPFEGTRYHSLVVEEDSLPDCLEISAKSIDDYEEIMAMRHKEFPVIGVQFHPESILTLEGKKMMKNFLDEV